MAEDSKYTRTIPTGELEETPRLVLEQAIGDVHVEGWDRPEIQISISDDDELFDVDQSGSQILVRSRPEGMKRRGEPWGPAVEALKDLDLGLERVASRVERRVEKRLRHLHHGIARGFSVNFGRWSSGLDYEIKVPHNCNLTLRTSTGDLSVRDVNGTLFLQATSGDIHMAGISGTALVHSASGDVHIDGVEGKLGAHTASGDLRVRKASLSELSVHSSSGDVELDLRRLPEGEWGVHAVSGDLDITIPRDSRLTVEVKTLSGDVDCSLPHERIRLGTARGKSLVINGGGPPVRLETVSGDVNIGSNNGSEGSRDEEDRPRTEGSRDEDRGPDPRAARRQAELEILQALERGELSAQDAMQRLSDL
jgi:hypothetical protein